MPPAGRPQPVHPKLGSPATIPDLLDFHFTHNPTLPFFVYASEHSDDVTEISFLEFGRACHRAAHLLRPNCFASPYKDGDVVAILVNADTLVYHAVTVGLMVAGLVPFPISPRNTPTAVINLLKKTSCHSLIATSPTLSTLLCGIRSELESDYDLDIAELPSLSDLYPRLGLEKDEDEFEAYPKPSTKPRMHDVELYLHSSGSTGLPKAIPESYQALMQWGASPGISQVKVRRPALRIAGMHLPAFHTFGIYAQVCCPLYSCIPMGLFPPKVLKPGDIVKTGCNALVTTPTFLGIWAQDEKHVDILKQLELVCYSGGAPSKKLGDKLHSSGVNICPIYGATEFGSPTYIFKRTRDKDDWEYLEFDAEKTQIRWVPQGDGTFECQLLTTPNYTLAVENLPDIRGYATSDLFERHPTKPHLWRIVGRADDVITHSSGEKTVPAPFEDVVMSSPYIHGVVMFGQKQDQPGALIEPNPEYAVDVDDQDEIVKFRNLVWPVIEEANKTMPAFSRVFKELILITSKDKPLPRAGKGTIMRKAALNDYKSEIRVTYENVQGTSQGEDIMPPASWVSIDDVKTWLFEQTADMIDGKAFEPDTDLFLQGFDSLTSTVLRRRITSALQTTHNSNMIKAIELVGQSIVYNYPTINSLAQRLVHIASGGRETTLASSSEEAVMRTEKMIAKYSVGLGNTVKGQKAHPENGEVVLLTGSTGNLGAQLLDILLRRGDVKKVYAFNRPSKGSHASAKERQEERFKDKGLDVKPLDTGKVEFVETDLAAPKLGLGEEFYEELCTTVTTIIHNAWLLNFVLSLSAFESNVCGTRNLINLALEGGSEARFLFTSSVASAQNWHNIGQGLFPEEVQQDARVASGNGYGESKYASERILASSGIDATSFRIGQISGGQPNGAWATTDWVPIMIKSSIKLGGLPTGPGVITWLPMDAVANSIADVAFAPGPVPMAVNIVHPRPIPWDQAMTAIWDALGMPELKLLPFKEWFQRLEDYAKKGGDATEVPAIKLLEFYRGIATCEPLTESMGAEEPFERGIYVRFATEKAQAISQTVKNVTPLDASQAQQWVEYWKSVNFL